MTLFRNYFLLLAAIAMLGSCKSKKKNSLAGEDPVEISDFIDFFPAKNVPFQFGDTTLNKKEKDSLLINYKVFTQFVPDSFMNKVFGKGVKPKIYPISRIKVSGAENYLFVKAVSGEKRAGYVFAFDKKDNFLDGIQLLRVGQYPGAQQSVSMDKGYSINKIVTRRNQDGSVSDGKDVYGLSKESGTFGLIMTDALDDKATEIINPIDTVSRKHKYSADYGSGKMNLVSIRDGRKSDRFSFFIHFEKNSGACSGELKGEAIIKSASVAEYRQGGDPCVLRFNFTSSSVTVKEVEGCGSHRDLRCSFDGTFQRKKEAKPAPKKQSRKK
jgi:hypothetical protein